MSTDATDPTLAQSATSHIGADDQALAPGATVGEYQIEVKIGEGGFGAVYKAVHPLIGKVAAVKVLSRQYSAQPAMVSRFVSEARAVNQIQDRHIIDIFSFGRLEDGRHYYVMEYLEGSPLEDYISSQGRLSIGETVGILRAVARALDAAHGKGIAHRDLKPDNVFLVQNDNGSFTPKLLDFGIAKLLSNEDQTKHKTKTGAPLGTPLYMSPEQCRGRDVDHRTDIYAFGVMAYRMLTGVLPFDGDDYMTILMQQVSDEAKNPSSIVPELPEGVDEAIAWMMKKSPDERPPNLLTAVRSLEDAATAAGIDVPLHPEPSGVYSARTTPLSQRDQSTPARVTPVGGGDTTDLASAPTMAPEDLPAEELPRTELPTTSEGPARASAALADTRADASRPDKKPIVLIAALVGAAIAAAALYFLVFATSESGEASSNDAAGALALAKTPASTPSTDSAEHGAEKRRRRGLVTLNIQGPPPGTEVYGPRGLLGVAPGKIQVPRRDDLAILTFKAVGYQARSIEVTPSEDQDLSVELRALMDPMANADSKTQTTTDGDDGDDAQKSSRKGSTKGSGRKGSGRKGSKHGSGDKGAGDISDRDTIEDPFK